MMVNTVRVKAQLQQLKIESNMCLYPKLVLNRKYLANKKNKGNPPIMGDSRLKYVSVGCSKCRECKKQKAHNWLVRLGEEVRINGDGKMITLTFSSENYKLIYDKLKDKYSGYDLDNAIATWAVRHWLERYRKKHKVSIKHWLVTEIGGNNYECIHIHGIIWSKDIEEAVSHWKYGIVWRGYEKNGKIENYVNGKTVSYITKYILKTDQKHKNYKSIVLTSSGIGKNYINRFDSIKNKYTKGLTNELYKLNNGWNVKLPIYYRNKIYSEEERELLWLEKLDKDERYIGGEKVSKDMTEQDIYKLLKYHRDKNKELGFGSDEKDYEQEVYERDRKSVV